MRHSPKNCSPERYGGAALVAGASEGIGASFARALARRGIELVLAARRPGPLEALAAELRGEHGVDVAALSLDLAAADATDRLRDACAGKEIGLLVYNAASSPIGRFLERPLADHFAAIEVNVRAPLALAHHFGGAMAARGRGGIVLLTSLAGFQGTPLVASYAATKAFDLVLAEGLWDELRDGGVDVLACCAGATATPGYERSAPRRRPSRWAPPLQSPDDVARAALSALGRRPVVVTGVANAIAAFVMRRVFSRRRAVVTMGREMRARYEPRDSG